MACKPLALRSALLLCTSMAGCMASYASYAAAEKVGAVGAALGSVSDTGADGSKRSLKTGDAIFQNDVIHAGSDGKAQILFLDKSALSITPDSEVKIDSFVYDPGAANKGNISLKEVKGAFRFIGGALSKENHVEIQTPVSTIGIRGGIEETHITPDGKGSDAIFIYGHDMTVKDQNGKTAVVTEAGAGISVQKGLAAPVMMSPGAVEHKMEQFNSAAKTPPASSSQNNTSGGNGTSGGKTNTAAQSGSSGSSVSSGSSSNSGTASSGTASSGTTSGTDSGTSTSGTSGSSGSGTASSGDSSSGTLSGSTSSGTSSGSTGSGTTSSGTGSLSGTTGTDSGGTTTTSGSISTIAQGVTATSSTTSTTSSSQQTLSNNSTQATYGGLYSSEVTGTGAATGQGTVSLSLSSNTLLGNYTQTSPTAASPAIVSLPAPGATGFSSVTANIAGTIYTGAVYAAPASAMFDYYLLSPDGTQEIFAVSGTPIAQSGWSTAVSQTVSANSGTNGIGFYNFLPEVQSNTNSNSDVTTVAKFESYIGSTAFSGLPLNGGSLAVNWTKNNFAGGYINWDSTTNNPSRLLAVYGTVTPGGGTLFSGSVMELSGTGNTALMSTNAGKLTSGTVQSTSQIYGPAGGSIDGFVVNGVEPLENLSTLGTAKNVYVPSVVAAPSSYASSSTGSISSGTLYGFAAGGIENVNATTMQNYGSGSSLDNVTVTTNATTGQVSASILLHNYDNPSPSQDVSASFGGGSNSVMVDNKIFAAGQNSINYQMNSVSDSAHQSGVLVAGDVMSNVTNKCTSCDYVQWGVWAGVVDIGTGTPNIQTIDMVPVVFGSPTPDSYLSTAPSGSVTYNGVLYGKLGNVTTNSWGNQEGTFTASIDLNNRLVNSFDGSIGSIQHFGFNTAVSIGSATYSGGTAPVFSTTAVTGLPGSTGSITGSINGALFGPTAQNVGGNYDVTQTVTGSPNTVTRSTGIFMGAGR